MLVTLPRRSAAPLSTAGATRLGASSRILHAFGRRHHWSGTGCLSIKSFLGGEALYDTGRGRFRVDGHRYLLLDRGEPYSITVESRAPVESFCVFFEDGLAEEVARSVSAPAERLLDDPARAGEPVRFFGRTYPHDAIVSPLLARLRQSLAARAHDDAWIDEQLREVLVGMLRVRGSLEREIQTLPALRASTREELYSRLHRARDFVDAAFDAAMTLDDMARIACLSPTHFLRSFRQLFRETPHRYLTRRRLERAAELLAHSERSVTEVCMEVGYESLGSFSTLFRRRYGVPPQLYRRDQKSRFREARPAAV